MKINDVILPNAFKRRKISLSETKAKLAARLASSGFKTIESVRSLSSDYQKGWH